MHTVPSNRASVEINDTARLRMSRTGDTCIMKGLALGLRVASAATLLTFTSMANANLINGGFESPEVGTGYRTGSTTWDYWNASDVPGWDGSNVEVWVDGFQGINAYEGDQFAELDAHPAPDGVFSISQSFNTQQGQEYALSFAYRARLGNEDDSNESFTVSVGDLITSLDDHTTNEWKIFNGVFTADGFKTTLTFKQEGYYKKTYGNFLDAVSITSSVTEPGSLALFGLGLAGLGLLRVKKWH